MLRSSAKWSNPLGNEQCYSSPFTRDKMEVEQIDLGFEPEARSLSAQHLLPGFNLSRVAPLCPLSTPDSPFALKAFRSGEGLGLDLCIFDAAFLVSFCTGGVLLISEFLDIFCTVAVSERLN